MSAETIARWNAIPLNRAEPDQSAQPSLKRPRDAGEGDNDDSEDNVSLVSRTPSPPPPDAMDVDKYDEYYSNKAAHEVITVETKIKSSNIGFSMLAKMGWVEGSPLGLSGDGRVEPVPFYVKNDLTGLGKANQDVRMIESTVSQRRELDSERQTKETEEQRRQREDTVARRAAVKSEISTVLRPFYCEVCDKQFQNVAQYDEHTNSYAHHHKVRFRDMQLAQRASRNTEEEVNKRKEKERKREEKELRKIAKAAGVKMAKPPVVVAAMADPSGGPATESKSTGFKKGGWATVAASVANTSTAPAEQPRRSGWSSVDESRASGSANQDSASAFPPPPGSAHPQPQPMHASYGSAPAFRTGGWTSLETSGNVSLPSAPLNNSPPAPPPPTAPLAPPPALLSEVRPGWSSMQKLPNPGGWHSVPPTNDSPSSSVPAQTIPSATSQTRLPPPPTDRPRQESTRSGWQKFRAGAPGRRR